ncbi:MAG: hypothetical protein GXO93_05200, partial [FCB group bacterium]|nr:hypothetical protein [FCB group bacterium]
FSQGYKVVYINGKFLDAKDAKISPLDRGFLYGEGAFETLRLYNGNIIFLKKHYQRLLNTLAFLNIEFKLTFKKLESIIYKLQRQNKLSHAYLRISVSKSTIFILIKKLPYNPEKIFEYGVSLRFSALRRNPYSFVPFHKTMNYIENINEKEKAVKRGFFDSLFVDISGNYITECATSNIFVVKNEILYTPSVELPLLPGVTRESIIELARNLKIKVKEQKIKKNILSKADEIFITNSIAGILPVKKIENSFTTKSIPGKLTKLLYQEYKKYLS